MEKLVITNFLSIEHAEIEIKKINLFIGPQAQGKSLISKLIYFFKEYPRTILEAVQRDIQTQKDCDHFALAQFEKIFPKYTWRNDRFKVTYSCKHFSVSVAHLPIDNEANNRKILTLILDNDENLHHIFDELLENKKKIDRKNDSSLPYGAILNQHLQGNGLNNCLYIPAARSLLATMESNVFAFLSAEIKLDYFLTLFGKHYGETKKMIKDSGYDDFQFEDGNQQLRIAQLVKKTIGGDFLFENNQSWIVDKIRKIHIADASSGQQEALPIALLLSTEPYHPYFVKHGIEYDFIIEEPEAHLFPVSQNDIVLLIANAYNGGCVNSFTIATHSPYILTAFNNLIQAGNVAASKNYEDLDALRAVVPESEWVAFDDVTAYVVNNGTVKSILNQELKLIDANMIDEVSDYFAAQFEKLICMESVDE